VGSKNRGVGLRACPRFSIPIDDRFMTSTTTIVVNLGSKPAGACPRELRRDTIAAHILRDGDLSIIAIASMRAGMSVGEKVTLDSGTNVFI
jgi:hypothetical protein